MQQTEKVWVCSEHGKCSSSKMTPKYMSITHWPKKKSHNGSSTAWKDNQTLVKELGGLAVEVSMEQRTHWMVVLSARSLSPASLLCKNFSIYSLI